MPPCRQMRTAFHSSLPSRRQSRLSVHSSLPPCRQMQTAFHSSLPPRRHVNFSLKFRLPTRWQPCLRTVSFVPTRRQPSRSIRFPLLPCRQQTFCPRSPLPTRRQVNFHRHFPLPTLWHAASSVILSAKLANNPQFQPHFIQILQNHLHLKPIIAVFTLPRPQFEDFFVILQTHSAKSARYIAR